MWHFASFVFGGLAMYAVSMLMFRTYMRSISSRFQAYEYRIEKKRMEVTEKTEAVRSLIDRINHEGLKPRMARLMGLLPLISHSSKEARLNIRLAQRPHHHKYAELAEKYLDELDETIKHLNMLSAELHEFVGKSTKDFEHLQDDDIHSKSR